MAYFKVILNTRLEVLRATENLSQNSFCPSRSSKGGGTSQMQVLISLVTAEKMW